MKYMALIYTDPTAEPQHGTPEWDQMMQGYGQATEQFHADGVYVSGDPLQGVETATSVRVRDGQTETMDGPFAETKEHLGGFYIFDVADLDAALKYAAMIPGAQYGTVEVRPIMDFG